jgi:hypothetical protein
MDFTTLNIRKLKALPLYHKPPSYTIQSDPGNGCFLDPPGYPTYFTRNVYTRGGNTPNKGVQLVILLNGEYYAVASSQDWEEAKNWEGYQSKVSKRIRSLWKPLPLEHPRTQAWIDYCLGYFKNCYVDPRNGDVECGSWVRDDNVFELADLLGLEYDQELKDRVTEILEAKAYDVYEPLSPQEELAFLKLEQAIYIKTDRGTQYIQEWYPEYQYEGNREGKYGKGGVGTWWERLAERPTPNECPGEHWQKHPANGTWCQVCGWVAE